MLNLCITTGEPSGIGCEISLKAALHYNNHDNIKLTLIGDKNHLNKIAECCNISLIEFSKINIHHIELEYPTQLGTLDSLNANYVINTINYAIDNCNSHQFDGMITAPIHKGILNKDRQIFTGHTEYLAQKTNSKNVLMLLSGKDNIRNRKLRVALATTHIPLQTVSNSLSKDKIIQDITLLYKNLQKFFKINNPIIKISGLNPHAGENGTIGIEEDTIIIPAIHDLKQQNINVYGPYSADTMFLQESDCFYCMYHDQGLAPFKYATFGQGVNITLGLPIIRTSVDHGIALNIANKFNADYSSMLQAIEKCKFLIKNK